MRRNVEDLFPDRCKPRSSNQGFAQRTTRTSAWMVRTNWETVTHCHATVPTIKSIGSCVNTKKVATWLSSGALLCLDYFLIHKWEARVLKHTGFHGKKEAHWISGSLVATAVVLTTVIVALGGLVLEGFADGLREGFAGFASTWQNEENIIPTLRRSD